MSRLPRRSHAGAVVAPRKDRKRQPPRTTEWLRLFFFSSCNCSPNCITTCASPCLSGRAVAKPDGRGIGSRCTGGQYGQLESSCFSVRPRSSLFLVFARRPVVVQASCLLCAAWKATPQRCARVGQDAAVHRRLPCRLHTYGLQAGQRRRASPYHGLFPAGTSGAEAGRYNSGLFMWGLPMCHHRSYETISERCLRGRWCRCSAG